MQTTCLHFNASLCLSLTSSIPTWSSVSPLHCKQSYQKISDNLVAAGFDAAEGDQLGGCFVTPACYAQMTHMLMSLAQGKLVVCLEVRLT